MTGKDLWIDFDEEILEIRSVEKRGILPSIEGDEKSYFVAPSWEIALEAAKKYWHDFARQQPDEFITIMGAREILEMWIDGKSLEDWLTQKRYTLAEETFAEDGEEQIVFASSPDLEKALGFAPRVAYRTR